MATPGRAVPVEKYEKEAQLNVRVEILFEAPSEDDAAELDSVARGLTNDPRSVRVFAPADSPGLLVVEFTMPTEPQYRAVETIDRSIRMYASNRSDSAICFPKTDAERERGRRKAERRRARRKRPRLEE
jgi:hypothetical protein